MNDLPLSGLLPAGFHDVLPPDAAHEAVVVETLMRVFAAHGYERVKPPLVEFEETLLGGVGGDLATETFRLMDPVSQRMMGVRADMTVQVARIAASRLARQPRPLRLAYAGQVLRVKGSQLRPERQFGQVGAELVGGAEPSADAEVALIAIEALDRVGVRGLSIDLSAPTLVPALLAGLDMDAKSRARLRGALDRKDVARTAELGDAVADLLVALLEATGPARASLDRISGLPLPAEAAAALAPLAEVAALVARTRPELPLTVDPVEHRGFEYHTGVAFTIFARGRRGEMGRGGRYLTEAGESATGVSLFMDTVMRASPAPTAPSRLYVPWGTDPAGAARLREEGWVTVAGLTAGEDPIKAAREQACTHHLEGGRPVALS